MGRPSGTSAMKGRLRKVGSLSLRSSRFTYTVVLTEERRGGVPPRGGARGTNKSLPVDNYSKRLDNTHRLK